jgi:hypothetical protein
MELGAGGGEEQAALRCQHPAPHSHITLDLLWRPARRRPGATRAGGQHTCLRVCWTWRSSTLPTRWEVYCCVLIVVGVLRALPDLAGPAERDVLVLAGE